MMLADGFYVIDAWISILLGLVAVVVLSFLVLRGPVRQSLVLSSFSVAIGVPLLFVAYYISFRMDTVYEQSYMQWMSGFACAPFVVGCIGLSLRLRRRKH